VPIKETERTGPSEDNYYGWSKLQAEQWLRIYQRFIPHVILRYAYVYGPQKDWGAVGAFLKNISNNKPPVIFGGNQANDFIFVDDVVDANIKALETSYINQTFNVGTGRATSIRDACEFCIEAMNSTIKARVEPARSFDYSVFLYNIDKARTLLRFEPKYSLRQGIMETVKRAYNIPALQHT
jgi:UDP-glucose 4-epimerase